jgi:hypothetical protein
MDASRREFKNLSTTTNAVWSYTIDSVSILFPYGYNFAAAYDEVSIF